MNKLHTNIFIAVLVILFSQPLLAGAATMEISAPDNIPLRQNFLVRLVLNTEGETLNAVSGIVHVAGDLEISDIYTGESIVGLWVKKPDILDKKISFSGLVPGGFSGTGPMFSLVLHGDTNGEATISVGDLGAYLDDGLGTYATIVGEAQTVNISSYSPNLAQEFVAQEDTVPPEGFEIFVLTDKDLFGGRYFAVFETTDKGSGVSYYEVQERDIDEPDASLWGKGESPYVLKDQSLGSYIFIKAVDASGNVRIATAPPQKNPKAMAFLWYGLAVLLGLYILRTVKVWYDARIDHAKHN